MSVDKRKVSTDALETLGTIITPDEKRDAIHLAVIPIQAPYPVLPGQHVNSLGRIVGPYSSEAVGIVDPFVTREIEKGEWFWLVIYPRKITSLRHVWSHPAFPEESEASKPIQTAENIEKERAKAWLEDHARDLGLSYDRLLQLAEEYGLHGDYFVEHGSERMRDNFEPVEFWRNWTIVTGRIPPDPEAQFFSCSC